MNFDFNRFLKQFKWDVLQHYRFPYVGYMVVFGIMMFVNSLNWYSRTGYHNGLFWMTLFLGGIIYTSTVFDEMNRPQPKQFYLTTPSSHLEKFISKLLLTTVVFTIVTVVVFTLMSIITTFISELRTGEDLPQFSPFDRDSFGIIKSYLILQSFFLLGAVTFREASFFKTIAIMLGLGFVFSVIWATVGAASLMEYLPIGGDFDIDLSDREIGLEHNFEGYGQFIQWLYFLALAPAMWVVTYFKLTEKEV